MSKKIFHDLSKKEQNAIRRKYKSECSTYYKHSIHLYIIYVILGIISILSMVGMAYINFIISLIILIVTVILMIITIHLLKKSNINFFNFLKENNMIYDSKNIKK